MSSSEAKESVFIDGLTTKDSLLFEDKDIAKYLESLSAKEDAQQKPEVCLKPKVPELNSTRRNSRGRVDVVLGAQWGDEGKGKLVDILSGQYAICARVAGGSNAGHTIVVEVTIFTVKSLM